MLKIFYRRFYILLFLVWLGATAGLFVLSVWGDLDTFITDFSEVVKIESEHDKTVIAARDVATQAVGTIVHKTKVAEKVVRQQVEDEILAVEEGVEKVFKVKVHPTHDTPVEAVVEARAQALLEKSRERESAGNLLALSFTEAPGQLVAHLKTSNSVGKVTRFWLQNPTRLVVDLRGDWNNRSSRNRVSLKDNFVYQVVLGKHSDRLRVVFRFDDPKVPAGELPELVYTDSGLSIVVDNPAN